MNENDVNRGDIADLESKLRRVLLPDSAAAGAGENRVLAKVHGYVRDNPPGTARDWSRLLLTLGAIGVPAAAAAAIAGILLFGHATTASKVLQPASSPVPAATPSPTVTSSQTVLVEVSTPPSLVGPQTVHWVTANGVELASKLLPSDEAVMGSGGHHLLVYRRNGHVLDLHMDGTADDLGSAMPKFTASGPVASLPDPVRVSPDGTQWIWGHISAESGNSVTSQIVLGGIGATPRTLVQVTEDNHSLEPFRWTVASPLIAHNAIGVGGYYLFDNAFGQVDELNLATGKQTAIGPGDTANFNHAVDIAGNGATAYMANQGAQRMVIVSGPGLRGLSANLPAAGQAGGLMFDPSSNHLVFATSPAVGADSGHERFETDIIDLNSGARSKFGPSDLRPQTWLPDGRLVEITFGDGSQPVGTYVVGLDGSAAKVSSYTEVIGFVDVAAPTVQRCVTSNLEVAPAISSGAAGVVIEVFEVRNKSQVTCTVNGYFGVGAVDGSGHVYIAATRTTNIPPGTAAAPHDVLLPAGTAPLGTGGQNPAAGIAGHAYFYVAYGHACNGGAPTGADRWQLIPPDQTQPIVLATQERTFCTPVVTPVEESPALTPH